MDFFCATARVTKPPSPQLLLHHLSSSSTTSCYFPSSCWGSHCFPSLHFQSLNFSCTAKKKRSREDTTTLQQEDEGETLVMVQDEESVDDELLEEGDDILMGDELLDDFDDEIEMDDNEDFEDEFEDEEANLYVGDGAAGGGISLAGTWWDKEALAIAEEVLSSFDGELKIYAFKTSSNSTIRVRIENLSTKYGSPSMDDIEAYSTAYRSRLDEAESAGTIPDNITLEVSSPGLERAVRIPEELERFKEKPMYVKYANISSATASPQESDGIFRLISYDIELQECTWGIADVKANRQQAGKGRPLNKKQREWRLQTPFESLRLVRLHSDC